MQQDNTSSANSGMMTMNQMSEPAQIRSNFTDLVTHSPYASIFFHSAASQATPTNVSASPITGDGKHAGGNSNAAAFNSLSQLMSEYQELLNRHKTCLSHLRKTFKEAETLRQENTNLRVANRDLGNQINLLIQAAALKCHYQLPAPAPYSDFTDQYGPPLSSVSERFSGLSTGEKMKESGCWDEGFATESPTSVMEKDQSDIQNVDPGRVTLPKSISVRSNGFLKLIQAPGPSGSSSTSGPVRGATRVRAKSPVSGPQKVYVRGGSKKEGPIELDVYNQGMFKTELCNKWQETGTCPYGDHCQFAHGISELRPVIRHPRYKTEVCRMVLAGDTCPYGHRCHFRHALSEQEKLMLPLTLD